MGKLWKVETEHKKSVEEHMFWNKDGRQFRIIQGFRWGIFTVETSDDNPPEGITRENPNGIDMYCYSGENSPNGAELDLLDDGWLGDYEWDDDFSEEEQEEIMSLWDKESFEGLDEAGWNNTDSECWLFGPLLITDITDDGKA